MTTGELHILNTGHGDITISFNEHSDEERTRAIAMLKDMQARGYAILVRQEDGTYVRAIEIDATRGQYIISTEAPVDPAALVPRRRGRPKKTRVPIEKASAVGVARSAGG
jgi:hypothetical protein